MSNLTIFILFYLIPLLICIVGELLINGIDNIHTIGDIIFPGYSVNDPIGYLIYVPGFNFIYAIMTLIIGFEYFLSIKIRK